MTYNTTQEHVCLSSHHIRSGCTTSTARQYSSWRYLTCCWALSGSSPMKWWKINPCAWCTCFNQPSFPESRFIRHNKHCCARYWAQAFLYYIELCLGCKCNRGIADYHFTCPRDQIWTSTHRQSFPSSITSTKKARKLHHLGRLNLHTSELAGREDPSTQPDGRHICHIWQKLYLARPAQQADGAVYAMRHDKPFQQIHISHRLGVWRY